MKDEIHDNTTALITRYLAGESSDMEEKQLLNWVDESTENKLLFEDHKRVFTLSDKHYTDLQSQNLPIDIDQEWNHFITAVDVKSDIPIRTLQPSLYLNPFYKIAAAVLILVVSGSVLNYFLSKETAFNYRTAENTRTISLPDGSTVKLNRYSELQYASSFGDESRTVTLNGEAFFDVAYNKQKPFVININKGRVEVVGTSFNVRAYDSVSNIEVVVKTGIVKFSIPALKQEVKLTAGQKGEYDTTHEQINNSVNTDVNYTAWNTGEITFEETDLLTVIETLNKTFGVSITLASNIPSSCVVTVTFDHQSLDAVLHVLETTLNLTYTRNGNQIEITKAGC